MSEEQKNYLVKIDITATVFDTTVIVVTKDDQQLYTIRNVCFTYQNPELPR